MIGRSIPRIAFAQSEVGVTCVLVNAFLKSRLPAGTGRATVPYGGGGRSRDAAIGPSRRLAARDLRGLRQHVRRGSPWGRRALGRRRPAASRNTACRTLFLDPAHRALCPTAAHCAALLPSVCAAHIRAAHCTAPPSSGHRSRPLRRAVSAATVGSARPVPPGPRHDWTDIVCARADRRDTADCSTNSPAGARLRVWPQRWCTIPPVHPRFVPPRLGPAQSDLRALARVRPCILSRGVCALPLAASVAVARRHRLGRIPVLAVRL